VFGRKARYGEDLHRLAGEKWCQRSGGNSRFAEGQSGKSNGVTLVIAKRAVRADELTDPVSAGEAAVWNGQHVASPFCREDGGLWAYPSPAAAAVSAAAGLNRWMSECERPSMTAECG
jgi:hypothetical protein